MTRPYNQEPWWHPAVLLGYTVAYLFVAWLLVGMLAIKLGRIAIGRD